MSFWTKLFGGKDSPPPGRAPVNLRLKDGHRDVWVRLSKEENPLGHALNEKKLVTEITLDAYFSCPECSFEHLVTINEAEKRTGALLQCARCKETIFISRSSLRKKV